MVQINPQLESALVQGIKTVGVGRKGSRSLSEPQVRAIITELAGQGVDQAVRGAFFGALQIKGLSQEERPLAEIFPQGMWSNPKDLAQELAAGAPQHIITLCQTLLSGENLTEAQAYDLGRFFFSNLPGDGARGLAASILRVRYESPEEYLGLWKALQETKSPNFIDPIPPGAPVIQLAEPFDGLDHSYFLTPVLSSRLRSCGYRPVLMTGESSGPKYGHTLLELCEVLNIPQAIASEYLGQEIPACGWTLPQNIISPAVHRWVGLRQKIIKRPFLATLEKFINPVQASILITSAFHPPYTEKMTRLAEDAGFPASIVVRNGNEGSLSFGLIRPIKILCSVRQTDQTYQRHEIEFNPKKYFPEPFKIEKKHPRPFINQNAELIQRFLQDGCTKDTYFDARCAITIDGILQAVRWIQGQWDHQKEEIS